MEYSGIATHKQLKKTRYTHMYIKLLLSRLTLPVSHSGQNVMNPNTSDQCATNPPGTYRHRAQQ